jgi:hypothetical protein
MTGHGPSVRRHELATTRRTTWDVFVALQRKPLSRNQSHPDTIAALAVAYSMVLLVGPSTKLLVVVGWPCELVVLTVQRVVSASTAQVPDHTLSV